MQRRVIFFIAVTFLAPASRADSGADHPTPTCDTSRTARLIVAEACAPLFPSPIRDVLAADGNDWLAKTIDSTRRERGNGHDSPHVVMLDVGSGEIDPAALRRAAIAFPRDRERGRELMASRARAGETGGTLPWALLDAAAALTATLREARPDRDAIVERCAWIVHLATDASMPSRTTRLRFHVDRAPSAGGAPSPEQRAMGMARAAMRAETEWMVRLERRLADEARVSPTRVGRLADPAEAVFTALSESHASLEALAWAVMDDDQEPSHEPDESESSRSAWRESRERRTRAALETADRVAPLLEERLERAILLAANLVTTAWHDAGQPSFAGAAGSAHAADDASPARRAVEPDGFVGSRQSTVFHHPNCPHARRLSNVNRIRFETRAQAIAAGRKPCLRCRPSD